MEKRATHVLEVSGKVLKGSLVMVTPDQNLAPVEAPQDRKAGAWDDDIAKVVDGIALAYHPVPVIDHVLVHFFDRVKGPQPGAVWLDEG